MELTSLVHGYGTLAYAVAYIDGVYRWLPWTLRVILGGNYYLFSYFRGMTTLGENGNANLHHKSIIFFIM